MTSLDAWHDFFLMVGGGAAALAGLVFVALSINLGTIARDAIHKNRAIGTLTSFTAVFMISACALMNGQPDQWFGLEWVAISGIDTYVYLRGLARAFKASTNPPGSTARLIAGTLVHAAQVVGGGMLAAGHTDGLLIASVAMTLSFASLVSGAWLLVVGIHEGSIKINEQTQNR
jgi:hypothetical protein